MEYRNVARRHAGQVFAEPTCAAIVRQSDTGGMNILVLSNPGDLDADFPQRVELPGSCTIGDGANGYTPVQGAAHLTLRREQAGLLRSHHQQVIGWMRCAPARIDELFVHSSHCGQSSSRSCS